MIVDDSHHLLHLKKTVHLACLKKNRKVMHKVILYGLFIAHKSYSYPEKMDSEKEASKLIHLSNYAKKSIKNI